MKKVSKLGLVDIDFLISASFFILFLLVITNFILSSINPLFSTYQERKNDRETRLFYQNISLNCQYSTIERKTKIIEPIFIENQNISSNPQKICFKLSNCNLTFYLFNDYEFENISLESNDSVEIINRGTKDILKIYLKDDLDKFCINTNYPIYLKSSTCNFTIIEPIYKKYCEYPIKKHYLLYFYPDPFIEKYEVWK